MNKKKKNLIYSEIQTVKWVCLLFRFQWKSPSSLRNDSDVSLEAWKQKHVTKVRGQTWISLAMAKGKKLNVMNSFRDCFCKYSALIYHKLYQKFLLLYGWFTGSLRMERWTCWAWFTFAAGSGSRKYSGSPCCSSNLSIFPLTSPDEAVCLQSTCLIFFLL